MAEKEKELRRMNRTELIEIIYVLQQNEKTLRQENEELKEKLKEKTIRIAEAGSIAEAALSLNRIFEDAQAAAEQYLHSVKEMTEGALKNQTEDVRENGEENP
ncbi:MAG: DNA repair protein [Clostridiales bacterium]|nr:DNA repair protein [Clostridiales bacterium]